MEDDPRFYIPQPQGVGEKTVLEMIAELEKRIRKLESQAGTT